jgi:hypothetical protein
MLDQAGSAADLEARDDAEWPRGVVYRRASDRHNGETARAPHRLSGVNAESSRAMPTIVAPVLCVRCKKVYVLQFSHTGRQTARCPRGHSITVTVRRA